MRPLHPLQGHMIMTSWYPGKLLSEATASPIVGQKMPPLLEMYGNLFRDAVREEDDTSKKYRLWAGVLESRGYPAEAAKVRAAADDEGRHAKVFIEVLRAIEQRGRGY